MKDEEPQCWPRRPVSKLQHRYVAVGIARSENRTLPDTTPDPRRLDRPIVEDIEFGFHQQVAAVTLFAKPDRTAGADHSLRRDAIDLASDLPDEITPTARHDVVHKPVRFEKAQEFDHRCVPAVAIQSLQRGMRLRSEEGIHTLGKVLRGQTFERAEHTLRYGGHVAFVTAIVLMTPLNPFGVVTLIGSGAIFFSPFFNPKSLTALKFRRPVASLPAKLPVRFVFIAGGLVASHSCLCQHLQVFVRRLLDGDTDKQDRPALEFAWRLILTANGIAAVEPDTEPVTR